MKKSNKPSNITSLKKAGLGRSQQTIYIIAFLIVFLIVSGYLFIPQAKEVNTLVPQGTPTTHLQFLASSEASISAKVLKTPKPIPTNFGRSVQVPIIYYHYIGKNPNPADKLRDNLSVDPELFEQQMAYIASNGYTTISFDTMYAALKGTATLPAKPLIVTFDDGYIDFYINAFPILRQYNIHATEFIPTGLVDTGYYLHWDQIKLMDQSGLISFEAHSINHANLESLSGAELKRQITQSRQKLIDELGKPVNFMAYPYGTSNAMTWQAVKDAGYFGAAGTWGGNIESEGNIYDMPRNKIPGGISMEDFKRKI